jgi:site-specific recombinase XerD
MFVTLTKKSPFYQLIYKVDGKPTTVSTKTKSKVEAYKFLVAFQKQLEQPIEKIRHIKLSSYVEEYTNYIEQSKTKSYLKSVKLSFSQFKNKLGDIQLNQISTRIIDQFISEVYSRSPYAAKLYYSTLKAAFSKAVSWNYLYDNPLKKIKAPKMTKSFPVFISEFELAEILNNTKSLLLKDIFTTAFYTGTRLSELLNMKWDWIDFPQNIISVKNSDEFKSKSKRERIIPVHSKVLTILKSRFPIGKQKENNFVFYRYSGIKLNEDFISKQFKKAVRVAKLNDKIHFHSLRHSFASALVQRGVSLYAVKELLGHEDIKTTQIYSHLQKENLCSAINLL